MRRLKNWELIELILKKPLEQIIDLATGDWKCGICKDKKKFFSKEAVEGALKEKTIDLEGKNGKDL